jgi:AraC-like DNA-binding protein
MATALNSSYSVRLVKPFIDVLRDSGVAPPAFFRCLDGLDLDARVSTEAIDTMLDAALRMTGDSQLGVKASARTELGVVGVFDFLLSSAATVRDSLEIACEYMPLLDDVADWKLSVDGERACLLLEAPRALAAAAEDFCLCGLIRNQASSWPSGMMAELEIWFTHASPADPTCYAEVVGPATFVFGAPRTGFGFPARYLDLPLRTGNPRLHDVLRRSAENALEEVPHSDDSLTDRVRRLAEEGLPSGDFSLESTAAKLRMSARTLCRRLAQEHTTFREVLEDVRKQAALDLVASGELELSEVAQRVGFGAMPAFYRAFRRWTGITPGTYRRMRACAKRSPRGSGSRRSSHRQQASTRSG